MGSIIPSPDILDALELWMLRAYEQHDETTRQMLDDIRESYRAGDLGHGNASVAVDAARKRLDPGRAQAAGTQVHLPPRPISNGASLIEVRVQIDDKTYSLQTVGAPSDALFATQVGRGVAEAIIRHGSGGH